MPVAQKPRHKRKPPTRTYELDKYLAGALEGYHVVMGAMSARDLIRLRSGELTEGEAAQFAASKVLDHDFDVTDILDIDAEDLLAISAAWSTAMRESAVPPAKGDS